MFLPAIPAYLWLWPNVRGTDWLVPAQVGVYLYLLTGALVIGRRQWTLGEIGVNRRGVGLSLACGMVFLAAWVAGRLAVNLPFEPQPVSLAGLVRDAVFYFGLVGLVEELLFRGLIYHALDEWRGAGLAVLGSSLAFGVYHLWQGPLGMFGCFVIGLVFGAIRWRAGGIVGLVAVHGLVDLVSVTLWPSLTAPPAEIRVTNLPLGIVSDALLVGLAVYLWKVHPLLEQRKRRQGSES